MHLTRNPLFRLVCVFALLIGFACNDHASISIAKPMEQMRGLDGLPPNHKIGSKTAGMIKSIAEKSSIGVAFHDNKPALLNALNKKLDKFGDKWLKMLEASIAQAEAEIEAEDKLLTD